MTDSPGPASTRAAPTRPALPRLIALRHDGWSLDRQLRFLLELERSRNVVRAAAAAGMSRAAAYRLKGRKSAISFAQAWDRILAGGPESDSEGDKGDNKGDKVDGKGDDRAADFPPISG